MFAIMAIALYTSRIVLDKLGVEDFGIYNAVAGVVSSLAILTQTLSSATSRFFTYELGRGNLNNQRLVVSTAVNIQIYLSVLVFVVGETIGIYFLNSQMNIPAIRISAANWIFQASLVSFVLRLFIVPLNAMIIAHEDMQIYAYISILDVIIQLGVVFLLNVAAGDKLIFYGWFIAFGVFLTLCIYTFYCIRKYKELFFSFHLNVHKFKEMASFSGWNFIGTSAGILENQGIDIIVNIFFGVIANAARGVANQLSIAVSRFTSSFTTALNPQIIKAYASNDKDRLHFLITQGSRFSFYLILFVAIPLVFEMNTILSMWLKKVPDNAVLFTQLQVCQLTISCISSTLITGLLATGDIKMYQIIVGLTCLLNFPLSCFFLYLGFPIYVIYIIAIIIEICTLALRLIMAKQKLGFPIRIFFKNVMLNVSLVSLVAIILPFIIHFSIANSLIRFAAMIIVSMFSVIIAIWFIGLHKQEKERVLIYIHNKLNHN